MRAGTPNTGNGLAYASHMYHVICLYRMRQKHHIMLRIRCESCLSVLAVLLLLGCDTHTQRPYGMFCSRCGLGSDENHKFNITNPPTNTHTYRLYRHRHHRVACARARARVCNAIFNMALDVHDIVAHCG